MSDFKDDARSSGHVFDECDELGEDVLVDFEELLGGWFVQCEHLQARDFEPLLQDGVDDGARETLRDGMRLDDAARTVGEEGGRLQTAREEEVALTLPRRS